MNKLIEKLRMDGRGENGTPPTVSAVGLPTTHFVAPEEPTPGLVHRTQFVEDSDQPLSTMHDIHDALGAKRTEQKLAIKRLSEIQSERAKAMQAMLILEVLDKEERDIIEKFDA